MVGGVGGGGVGGGGGVVGAVYNREYNGRIMAATASVSLRQTFTNSTIFVHTISLIFVHTIDNFLYCLHIQFLTLIIQICCMLASSCGQHCLSVFVVILVQFIKY